MQLILLVVILIVVIILVEIRDFYFEIPRIEFSHLSFMEIILKFK